jgi:hypothetical protein
MRLIMRLTLPAAILAAPDFTAQWQALLQRIGARDDNAQGRLHYVLLDIEPGQITPAAEAVFRLAGVKPDFLPEIAPQPYYGIRNY